MKSLIALLVVTIIAILFLGNANPILFASPVSSPLESPTPTPTVNDQCVNRCIRERSPVGEEACICKCQTWRDYDVCMGFATPTPTPISTPTPFKLPTPVPTPTRVWSDDQEFNDCVSDLLWDYPDALQWIQAYCRGDADHPSTFWPTPTPTPSIPYEEGNYACWQACISEYPDRVEGWCLCECGIEDNGICTEIPAYEQDQVLDDSDEFLSPPPRPLPTSIPVPIVTGEFAGTWWKNEVTECNLYSDSYRIVRIECEIE